MQTDTELIKKVTTSDVVNEIETKYPETTQMFKEVMQHQYELFCLIELFMWTTQTRGTLIK